jgi:hypothetical protein
MKSDKKKRGRPQSAVDLDTLERLAGLACTIEEAAAVLRVSKRTLLRRLENPKYKRVWDEGLLKANVSLRRRQWTLANSDAPQSAAMLLHLCKHRLGQTDKAVLEMTGRGGGPIQHMDFSNLDDEQLKAKAAELGLPNKVFDD